MAELIKSLVLLIIVSGTVSLFCTQWKLNFWITFLSATVIQIVGWKVFSYYQQIGIIKKNQELEEEMIKNLGKQQAEVPCASCGHKNIHDIQLDTANTFTCEACNVKNAIYINIETAAMTVIDDK